MMRDIFSNHALAKKAVRKIGIGQITLIAGFFTLAACTQGTGTGSVAAPSESDVSYAIETLERSDIADMQPRELIDISTQTLTEITQTLSHVSDETTARAALSDLSKLTPKLDAMKSRLETMQEGDIQMNLGMIQSMSKFGTATVGLMSEVQRLHEQHPELSQILKDEIDKIEL